MLLIYPINKPCHEILVFDQTNNDDAVSHVSIRNFKHPPFVLTSNVHHGFYLTRLKLTKTCYNQRANGSLNTHLISWTGKAQNIQNLENIW